MIEACLATKKIWMLSQDMQLPPSWIRTRPQVEHDQEALQACSKAYGEKAGLGRNQYQLTDVVKELLESSSLSSEEDSSNQQQRRKC
jgi:hypothetical protein